MNQTTTIVLDVELAGELLSGSARAGRGPAREFTGRLGLMRAIEELLAAGGREEERTMNPTDTLVEAPGLEALRARIAGDVYAPGEDGWNAERGAFNLTVNQTPALVAVPAGPDDVATIVRFAGEAGLRVAPQRTGHNAGPLGSLEGTILLKTNRLDSVEIDAAARRAWVGAGARWEDVVPAASELGLAALHGSTPDVSIAGYSLGGGLGWYGRKHGLAVNRVTSIDLVTPGGERVRADAENEAQLFWALRGGGGNFGVVTALEFELLPIEEVYAGVLFFPLERAGEVLHAWHEWTPTAPEEVTSVGRVLRFPPLPEVPEPVRGQSFAVVEAVCLGGEEEGAAALAPLRALGPAIDTFAMVPPAGIAELHMDPRDPVPAASEHSLLGGLDAAAIDAFLAAVGPESGCTLVSVELRHTGGALGRTPAGAGALGRLPGEFAMFAVGIAATPELTAATEADLARVAAAVAPYEAGHYLNFVEEKTKAEGAFEPEVTARLLAARDAYDPERRLHPNHEIGPRR
jgi:FAD/FMN-containing dehydrogenase